MDQPTTCPAAGWTGYSHDHDDAEDGPRSACCACTCGDEEEHAAAVIASRHAAYHAGDDIPPGATFEPWSDADTAELADAMSASRDRIGAAWSSLLALANARRRWHVGRVLGDTLDGSPVPESDILAALRDGAAESGIVPDPLTDPMLTDARQRQAELLAVWSAWTTSPEAIDTAYGPDGARYYESSDGFEERHRGGPVHVGASTIGAALTGWPIVAAGVPTLARVLRS